MLISEIMTTKLVTVTLDDRLSEIKNIFDHARFHHLPVVEEGKLIGILSVIDLLSATGPSRGTPIMTINDVLALKNPVHRIVTRHPVTVGPDMPVEQAIDILLQHNFSCLPVVSPDLTPLGIVTWRDFLKHWPRPS